MSILQLISSRNFITLNKSLIQKLGLEEAIMLGELASEHDYWEKEGKLEDDYFFSTVENIEKNTTLSEYKQRKAIVNLKKIGLIDIKLKGLPAKRYIKINEDVVLELFSIEFQKNSSTSSLKTTELVPEKLRSNNNIINNNIINNKKDILSKDNIPKKKKEVEVPYKQIQEMYHTICSSLPKTRGLGENRKKIISARYREYDNSIDIFEELFTKAEQSSFLKGNNDRNWIANFDWLLNQSNMTKVLECRYVDKKTTRSNRIIL